MSSQEEEPRDAEGSREGRISNESTQLDDLDARDDQAAEVKGGPNSTPWDKA